MKIIAFVVRASEFKLILENLEALCKKHDAGKGCAAGI
jgi:hypothetical protein